MHNLASGICSNTFIIVLNGITGQKVQKGAVFNIPSHCPAAHSIRMNGENLGFLSLSAAPIPLSVLIILLLLTAPAPDVIPY